MKTKLAFVQVSLLSQGHLSCHTTAPPGFLHGYPKSANKEDKILGTQWLTFPLEAFIEVDRRKSSLIPDNKGHISEMKASAHPLHPFGDPLKPLQ